MIEFVTLLLGLIAGPQPVEVSVDARVARVEMILDGRPAGSVEEAPWTVECDFGPLSPHELVAVAYDGEGRELARTAQLVNVPRDRTEVRISVNRPDEGPPFARLIYTALDFPEPTAIEVTLDGEPLTVDDPQRIVLPDSDPRSIHFLRARLEMPDGSDVRAEQIFGGLYAEETSAELTALLFRLDGKVPKPDKMAGWLTREGRPLEIVAAERGPAEIFVIREKSLVTMESLTNLWFLGRRGGPGRSAVSSIDVLQRHDKVRFAFPVADSNPLVVGQGIAPLVVEMVDVSADVSASGDLFYILTRAYFPDQPFTRTHEGIADAVAIAGLEAAATDRRTAVVLVRSGVTTDTSRHTIDETASYLAELSVPLRVWTLPTDAGEPSPWPEHTEIADVRKLGDAMRELRELLREQVVVWVRGAHLPAEVEISPAGRRLSRLEGER